MCAEQKKKNSCSSLVWLWISIVNKKSIEFLQKTVKWSNNYTSRYINKSRLNWHSEETPTCLYLLQYYWNQSSWASTDKNLVKKCCIDTVEYKFTDDWNSDICKKWMKQESTLLSELNHIQQEIYCMLLFISRGLKRVKFNAQLILLIV